MIYLKIEGRLGNQLFQYAFARKIQKITGDKIAIDWTDVVSKHKEIDDGWEKSLELFNINEYIEIEKIPFTKKQAFIKNINFELKFYNRYKYFRWLLKPFSQLAQYFGLYLFQDGYFNYTSYKNKNKIILGYFESAKNFSDIDDIIKTEFVPKAPELEKNLYLYEVIKATESICVSIRRGDFFSTENVKRFGVCDEQYYYNGIDLIKEIYPQCSIIVFSDDMNWVRQNMNFGDNVFYEDGTDPLWEKLRLMYSCKHFVISNSTFSWWAQHLSQNPDKIVIAPKQWRIGDKKYEIKEENWFILESMQEEN